MKSTLIVLRIITYYRKLILGPIYTACQAQQAHLLKKPLKEACLVKQVVVPLKLGCSDMQ